MKKFTTFIKSINMKIAAIILNCILIIIFLALFIDELVQGRISISITLLVVVLLGCPIVNLFILSKSDFSKERESCIVQYITGSWLALYFKRKRLEEQQKIDALNKKSEQKQ